MGELIYVNFKTKDKKSIIHIPEDDKDPYKLQQRMENIQGSLDRINKLIADLKSGEAVNNLTNEEVNHLIEETFDRR
jgi:hypothetical protein